MEHSRNKFVDDNWGWGKNRSAAYKKQYSTRVKHNASSCRLVASAFVEEDTGTQISVSSSVQTRQTGTSSRLLFNQGIRCHKKEQYSMALKSFFSALRSQIVESHQDHHPFLALTLANIGSTYLRQGRPLHAIETLFEALTIMKRLRSQCKTKEEASRFKLSGILNNMGTCYLIHGDRHLSMKYYHEALEEATAYRASKQEITNVMYNIGRLSTLQQDWEAAISLLNQSLRFEKELYGTNSMAVVDTLNLIGFAHFSSAAYDAATVVFAEALSIVHSNYGLLHENVATSLLNVGMVMEYQGRLDEALYTFSTARDVFERIGMHKDFRSARIARESIENILLMPHKSKSTSRLGQKSNQRRGKMISDRVPENEADSGRFEHREETSNSENDGTSSIVDPPDLDSTTSDLSLKSSVHL